MDKDHDLMAIFKGSPHVYDTLETTPIPIPTPTSAPTPTPTPSPTASPSPSPSPKPLSSQESFPTTTGATASGVTAAIIGIVYWSTSRNANTKRFRMVNQPFPSNR